MANDKLMQTNWRCVECGRSGSVTYGDGTDVYTVINLIEDSHAKASPRCKFDVTRVKVARFPEEP